MSEFTTTTRTGWGSRLKSAFGGIIFGFLLLAVGAILLFTNEGRSVKRYKDLKEGAGAVVTVDSASVDPANEGKLVHTTGTAVVNSPVSDPLFGISEKAVKLDRNAEMYQWVEKSSSRTEKKVGGSTETTTTYSYEKAWQNRVVDSSGFKKPEGRTNPTTMQYPSESRVSDDVDLGAFQLPGFLVSQIGGGEPYALESLENASEEVRAEGKLHQSGVYFGKDPAAPEVGDIRVNFTIVRPGEVSLVAKQQGQTFASYTTSRGGKLDLLSTGIKSADEMFTAAEKANKMLTWGLRIGGFVLLLIGFNLLFKPLSVLADVLPIAGNIVGAGTGLIAFLLAALVWTLVVAVAWIFYRPLLGIALLVVTVACFVLIVKKVIAARKKGAAEDAGPAPAAAEGPPPME